MPKSSLSKSTNDAVDGALEWSISEIPRNVAAKSFLHKMKLTYGRQPLVILRVLILPYQTPCDNQIATVAYAIDDGLVSRLCWKTSPPPHC